MSGALGLERDWNASVPQPGRLAQPLSRAVIWLLGAYLLAQFFSLPVLHIGPWALWPTLPDLLLWAAFGCSLLYRQPMNPAHLPVWRGLLLMFALALLSFGLLFVMRDSRLSAATGFGSFQLYKLAQTLAIFWMVARIPLTPAVLRRWYTAAAVAFTLMLVSVLWTYFSGVLPKWLGEFLPHGKGVSGPWEAYYLHNEPGLGMVGYNHGYVALQVMTLAALPLILRRTPSLWWLYAALIGCFLSGSRAGLAGCLLFAVLEWRRVPVRAGVGLVVLGVLGLAVVPFLGDSLGSLASRQATILDASDPNNLAGRTDIWQSYLDAFAHDPYRLLIGSGFGSAINNNSNAHFLPLQILYETGVAGLVAFGLFFSLLVNRLRATASVPAGICLSLLAGLSLTAFSQETFYPNPAFGGFLPLLALVIAVALFQLPAEASA
ncbi:O-antigen ligase family protein [Deinococcus ruber]|uniref:O-antigen ligase-related domain-containing protein n=1 Tax=Deinococcus ruber TaxID=1848197 RepID=A0A918C859_9DEIO|nr:O-antigen ligase family protein [Deinococcus ruber]GGR10674.1 hypothetical protein GCM10008957_24240 [Deinococcus ruber]